MPSSPVNYDRTQRDNQIYNRNPRRYNNWNIKHTNNSFNNNNNQNFRLYQNHQNPNLYSNNKNNNNNRNYQQQTNAKANRILTKMTYALINNDTEKMLSLAQEKNVKWTICLLITHKREVVTLL